MAAILQPNTPVLTSVLTWYIYHRFEPSGPLSASILLLLVPIVTTSCFQASLLDFLLTLISHWFLLLTLTIGYRLSPFHPLARYPGPVLSKVSKLWTSVVSAKGYNHRYVRELHQKYGDVVRIGPNELSFRSADAVVPILGGSLRKGPYYDSRKQENDVALDGIRDLSAHTARRKPWTKGTGTTASKIYAELARKRVNEFMETLESKKGAVINICDWLTFLTFDFMGEMIFSTDFKMMKNGKDSSGILRAIDRGTFDAGIVSHIPWILEFLKYLPQEGSPLAALQSIGAQLVKERTEKGSNKQDLFYWLVDSDDSGSGVKLNPETAQSDGVVAIIAGSDTSATALSHIFWFLIKYPDVKKRIQAEIDSAFPDGEDTADYTKQTEMKYLNAVINEALRLYPPVMLGLQRRVENGSGGRMIASQFVPEGTQVSAHIFSLQRDPRHFSPLPDTFWPDRWLDQSTYKLPTGSIITREQLTHDTKVFQPFSLGPQSCPGKNISWMEMRAALCAVFQKFDIEAVKEGEGSDDVEKWEDRLVEVYITHKGPLRVILKDHQ